MNLKDIMKSYEKITRVAENKLLVMKDNKYGLLDENYNVLICRIYDSITVGVDNNNIFNCLMDGINNAYIIKNKVIDVNCDFDYVESFYSGNNIMNVKSKDKIWKNIKINDCF